MRTHHCPSRKRNKTRTKEQLCREHKPEDIIVKIPTGKVDVVGDFIADIWEVLTPEMVNRLEIVLMEDMGISRQKTTEFITNLKNIQKERICYGKMFSENRIVRVGVRNRWIKEVSNIIADQLAEVVVDILLSNRTSRTKRLTGNILNHLCLLTGENATLESANTRIERTMVVVADRMAKWIDEGLTDIEQRKECVNDIEIVPSESTASVMGSIKSSESDCELTEDEASFYPVYPCIPVCFDSPKFDQEPSYTAPQASDVGQQPIQQNELAKEITTSDEESSRESEEDIEIIEDDEDNLESENEQTGIDSNTVQDKDKTKRERKDKNLTKTKPKTERKLTEREEKEKKPSKQGKDKKIKKEDKDSKKKGRNDESVEENKDGEGNKQKSKKNKVDKKTKKGKGKNIMKTKHQSEDTISEIDDNNKIKEDNLTEEEDDEDVESDAELDKEIEEEEIEMSNGEPEEMQSEEELEEEQEQVEEEEVEVEEESEKEVENEEEDKSEEKEEEESEEGEEEESEEGEEEEIEEEGEIVKEEDEKVEDISNKSKKKNKDQSVSTSTTSLNLEDIPLKTSVECQITDIFDLLKDDMKRLEKGDPKSERLRAIKKIVEQRFKSIATEKDKRSVDTLMKCNIDEAASIAANWVENILSSADIVSKPSSISSIFEQGSAFQIKRANNNIYEASKLSYRTVAQKVADVRGIELGTTKRKHYPKTMSPINDNSTKEWADWALGATNMGDKWGKWLETKISDMEKRLLNGELRANHDRYKSWTNWRNTAQQEAKIWRAENRQLKDEGNAWKKKLQIGSVNINENETKNILY